MGATLTGWGLVLEGGGMRGLFSAGVVDALINAAASFPYIIGVSAGSTIGACLLSGQPGRTRYIDIDLLQRRPFVGFRQMLRGRGVIDLDFLFDVAPVEHYPFDFAAYASAAGPGGSLARLVCVSTDAASGEARYDEEYADQGRFIDVCRASCALPLLCPPWHVDHDMRVDGGVADSIPFRHALGDGCRRVAVVLTKPEGFRRDDRRLHLPAFVYRRHPRLREALATRGQRYNAQLDDLERARQEGLAVVVRPDDLHGVGRTTTDPDKLEALYADGLRAGERLANTLAPC